MGRMIIKPAKWHTSRPMWGDENSDVVETAMIDPEVEGAEYRQTEGQQGIPMGSRAAGADAPDGAEPMGLKNKAETEG